MTRHVWAIKHSPATPTSNDRLGTESGGLQPCGGNGHTAAFLMDVATFSLRRAQRARRTRRKGRTLMRTLSRRSRSSSNRSLRQRRLFLESLEPRQMLTSVPVALHDPLYSTALNTVLIVSCGSSRLAKVAPHPNLWAPEQANKLLEWCDSCFPFVGGRW